MQLVPLLFTALKFSAILLAISLMFTYIASMFRKRQVLGRVAAEGSTEELDIEDIEIKEEREEIPEEIEVTTVTAVRPSKVTEKAKYIDYKKTTSYAREKVKAERNPRLRVVTKL